MILKRNCSIYSTLFSIYKIFFGFDNKEFIIYKICEDYILCLNRLNVLNFSYCISFNMLEIEIM